MYEFKIEDKIVDIFYEETIVKKLPVIIINTFSNEGIEIWKKCKELNTKNFILIAISKINWNNDMTPWECPPLFKDDNEYLGYADKYLVFLENEVITKIQEYITNILHKEIKYIGIAGYSLGGLFALYSGYKTNIFKRIVCASGSLWYPNFVEYINENRISKNIDTIYFSLGNKESNSKTQILQKVKCNTMLIYENLSKNINTIFEENEGNHFKDTSLRMAKGIKWILE